MKVCVDLVPLQTTAAVGAASLTGWFIYRTSFSVERVTKKQTMGIRTWVFSRQLPKVNEEYLLLVIKFEYSSKNSI